MVAIRRQSWREALNSLEALKVRRRPLPFDVCSAAIAACGRGQQWQRATLLLEQHLASVPETSGNVAVIAAAIHACSAGSQWARGLQVLAGRMGLVQNDFVCSAAVGALQRGSRWQEALRVFAASPSPRGLIASNVALRACEASSAWHVALLLLTGLGCRADVVSYTTCVNACASAAQWAAGLRLFWDLLKRAPVDSLAPNALTYGAALKACQKAGRWRDALSLLREMADERRVSAVALNSAMDACVRGKRWQHALVLFEDFRRLSVESDVVSYCTAVGACAQAALWPACVVLLAEMVDEDLEVQVARNTALAACEKQSAWQPALGILGSRLEASGPGRVLAARACADGSAWRHALALAEDSDSDAARARVLAACLKSVPWALALRMMEAEEAAGAVDLMSCSAAMKACQVARQWQRCLGVLDMVSRGRLRVDTVAYNTLLSAMDAWQQMLQVLQQMHVAALRPDAASCGLVLEAAGRDADTDDWRRALHLLRCLEQTALFPDLVAYDSLITALARAEQPELGLFFLAESEPRRSPLSLMWALAELCVDDAEVIHGACVEAAEDFRRGLWSPGDLSQFLWCCTVLGALPGPLRGQVAQALVPHLSTLSARQLAETAVGAEAELLQAVQAAALALDPQTLALAASGKYVLGILFAASLRRVLRSDFLELTRARLLAVGRGLDADELTSDVQLGAAEVLRTEVQRETGADAFVQMDLCDRAVVYKPQDWEVYGNHTSQQLSAFVASAWPGQVSAPILRDRNHNRGFLHRLDVPSSGLILFAKTFEAFYDLQVQLCAGEVLREYAALCHGWAPSRAVTAQQVEGVARPARSGGRGKPSRTHLALAARDHALGANRNRALSEVVLRLGTGRKHQIRSHLAHVGHPVVRDGLYTSRATFQEDLELCARNWLHRQRLTFRDVEGRRRDVFCPLPADLSAWSWLLDSLPKTVGQAVSSNDSCHYHSGGHGAIRVVIGSDNVRSLVFDDDPGFREATIACKGRKPHLLRWPLSKAPATLSCEDPAVKTRFRCEAPDIDKTDWPGQWVAWLETCRMRPQKVLFLGLGGGYYQSYLAAQCPGSQVLTLENNATVLAAARDYFGFQGDVMLADATDGMKYLQSKGVKFDAVISDMGQRPIEDDDLLLAQKLLRPGGTFLFQWCYGGLRKHEMKLDKMMDFFVDVSAVADKDGRCTFYAAEKAASDEHAASLPETVWAIMLLLKIQIFQVADTLPNLTPDVISDYEMFYPIGTLVPNMELVMGLQALLGLITWLRVLKYLTLSRTFLPFVRVFERCFIALIKYSALLSVALFGFAVAIYIGFGTEEGIYNSIWSTFVAVAVAPAGGVDLSPVIDKTNSLVAPIILFSYIIVVVLLVLTTFNAIQIDSYSVTTYELLTLKRHKAAGAGGDPTIIFIWTYLNALKGVKLVGKELYPQLRGRFMATDNVRYHILYWEGENQHGIYLEQRDIIKETTGKDGAGRCFVCGHAADTWRNRLDNMSATLRMVDGPSGTRFRQDVVAFHCLSPKLGISYDLRQFERFLLAVDQRSLTENHILGTALAVSRREIPPASCGVTVSPWRTQPWERWMEEKAKELSKQAEERGGVSVGLLLDKDGFEVRPFGTGLSMFTQQPEKPIREILVVLGGPRGIEDNVLTALETAGSFLHLGLMKVKLPGGLQHSCVALGDLLAFHDRGYLQPIMEDHRDLGKESYKLWTEHMQKALHNWTGSELSLEDKKEALRGFIRSCQSGQRDEGSWHYPITDDLEKTPSQVEAYLAELQAEGTLLGKRPWRVRQSLQRLEPGRAFQVLAACRAKRLRCLKLGFDFEAWQELGEDLDRAIEQKKPKENSTPEHVRLMLRKVRAAAPARLEEAGLEELSCELACQLLDHLLRARRVPPRPPSRCAGLAAEAALWAAKRHKGVGAQLTLQGVVQKRKRPRVPSREDYHWLQSQCKRKRPFRDWKWPAQPSEGWTWQGNQTADQGNWADNTSGHKSWADHTAPHDQSKWADHTASGDQSKWADDTASGDQSKWADQPASGDQSKWADQPASGDQSKWADQPAFGDQSKWADHPDQKWADHPVSGDHSKWGDRPDQNKWADQPASGDQSKWADNGKWANHQSKWADHTASGDHSKWADHTASGDHNKWEDRTASGDQGKWADPSDHGNDGKWDDHSVSGDQGKWVDHTASGDRWADHSDPVEGQWPDHTGTKGWAQIQSGDQSKWPDKQSNDEGWRGWGGADENGGGRSGGKWQEAWLRARAGQPSAAPTASAPAPSAAAKAAPSTAPKPKLRPQPPKQPPPFAAPALGPLRERSIWRRSKKAAEAKPEAKAPEAKKEAPAAARAPGGELEPAGGGDDPVYTVVEAPENFVVEGLKLAGGVLSDHEDVRAGKVVQVAKHPEEFMMHYWLKVEYGDSKIAFVHTLMSCGWNSSCVIRDVGAAQFPPDPNNLPAGKPKEAAAPAAAAPAAPAETPAADGLYKITENDTDFVIEGLNLAGGAISDHEDVRVGKVVQVAKHPEEFMMQYWLKVEYGESKIAFVHTMMSCGWNSSAVIRDVGDAQFPPDPNNLPAGKPKEAAPVAAEDSFFPEPVYTLVEAPEAFVLESLKIAGGEVSRHKDIQHEGKVLQVAKHPEEMRMQYWLKVEYGDSKIAFVHTFMSCGWNSDYVLRDVGEAQFPPPPTSLMGPPEAGAGPLPDLKPSDYAMEFVDPSHQEAIKTDADLKSAFPEMSEGDVKSIWRGPTGFWLEVVAEPDRTRYGAHFLQDEESRPEPPYKCNCAVRLAADEEFPPEPLVTKGKAVAFS
ncbi:unnamed protein product [Effrenium voratum]|uniref:Pentatricopeptide repeat-containing protein, chloroplastic n=1 Tax=Effrenium voratum TaxID=2562239 RepID=A0AA36I0V5_9DINO|nr:unnamed protein product [Effrenium voratum]